MVPNEENDVLDTIKLVLGGRWGVGKTSIRRNFLGEHRFKRNYLPTIGSDFDYKDMTINGNKIRILLWDLAGEMRFRKFRSLYFQGASGAILVFDLTDIESFKILDEWVSDFKNETATKGAPLIILGNKSDLILDSSEKCVTTEEVLAKIEEFEEIFDGRFDISYYEVSALSGKNIQESYKELIRKVLIWRKSVKVPPS